MAAAGRGGRPVASAALRRLLCAEAARVPPPGSVHVAPAAGTGTAENPTAGKAGERAWPRLNTPEEAARLARERRKLAAAVGAASFGAPLGAGASGVPKPKPPLRPPSTNPSLGSLPPAPPAAVDTPGASEARQKLLAFLQEGYDVERELGVGGLDRQFGNVFRRAFASRAVDPELAQSLGVKHVKGLLLYGPPGTGKTLAARQLARALAAKPPRVVNGPEIFQRFVGQSEENVRDLFAGAEADHKRYGASAPLHVVILDEIDAICRARGTGGATGNAVHDNVVNQMLTKLDGVQELPNILVIGITNRRDMLDPAILRPGRLELQVEVGLPDSDGRASILRVHTKKMREAGLLGADVDLRDVAARTRGFSGAELAGLVNTAASYALGRAVAAAGERSPVGAEDFTRALAETAPALRSAEGASTLAALAPHGLLSVGRGHASAADALRRLVANSPPVAGALVAGSSPGCGSSALAAHAARLAADADFATVHVVAARSLPNESDAAAAALDEARRAVLAANGDACVLLDGVEHLLGLPPAAARDVRLAPAAATYDAEALRALLALASLAPKPDGHRVLLLASTSDLRALRALGVARALRATHAVGPVETAEVLAALPGAVAPEDAECLPPMAPLRPLLDALTAAAHAEGSGPGVVEGRWVGPPLSRAALREALATFGDAGAFDDAP